MNETGRPRIEGVNRSAGLLRTTRRYYRINRHDISFLRFILEAYDGAAIMTTQDAQKGIVRISVAPGCESLVDGIINQLSATGDIMIEPLTAEDCRL